jgi:ribosomal protein L32
MSVLPLDFLMIVWLDIHIKKEQRKVKKMKAPKTPEVLEQCPSCGEFALGYAAREYGDGNTCLTCYYESEEY